MQWTALLTGAEWEVSCWHRCLVKPSNLSGKENPKVCLTVKDTRSSPLSPSMLLIGWFKMCWKIISYQSQALLKKSWLLWLNVKFISIFTICFKELPGILWCICAQFCVFSLWRFSEPSSSCHSILQFSQNPKTIWSYKVKFLFEIWFHFTNIFMNHVVYI